MIILVVSTTYQEYRSWLRSHFPYFGNRAASGFEWIQSDDFQHEGIFQTDGEPKAASLERGTPYFLLSGRPSEEFKRRFTQIQLAEV